MSFMTLTKWIDCSIYWLLLRKKKKRILIKAEIVKVFGRITHPRAGYFYCHLTSFRLFFEFRLTPCLLLVVFSLSTLSSSRRSFALPKWRIATRAIYPQKGKSGGRERTESGHKAGNKRGPKRTVCCARMASWVKMGKRKLEGNKDFSSFLYQCCVKCRWKGKKIKKKEGIKLCTQVTSPIFTISRRSSFLPPPFLSLTHTEAGTKIRR